MATEDISVDLLVLDIDQQLRALSEKEYISQGDDAYICELQKLRTEIIGPIEKAAIIGNSTRHLSSDLANSLWKIPVFSSPCLSFIQPEIMIERANAICRIQRQETEPHVSSANLWVNPHLHLWASLEKSTTIKILGSSQSTMLFNHFGCEIVSHLLERDHPTVYILNNADIRKHFKRSDPDELLRQLACQLLRLVSTLMPIPLLIGMLPKFKSASVGKDWFHILELLMQELTSLFIVIDASVLQERAKTAEKWVSEFGDIFKGRLKNSNACVKVMILSNRKIEDTAENVLCVQIEREPEKAFPNNMWEFPSAQRRMKQPLSFFVPAHTKTDQVNDSSSRIQIRDLAVGVEDSKQYQSIAIDEAASPGTFTQSFKRSDEDRSDEDRSDEDRSDEDRSSPECVMLKQESNQTSDFRLASRTMSSADPITTESEHPPRHIPITKSSREHHRRQEIGVAIICALSWEADAVEVICDEIYDTHDFSMVSRDLNVYTVVQIGQHKAVIVFMPAIGKISAAASARDCSRSFPNIQLVLLTGICGGIPCPYTNDEIILGDVVISDRLVFYDFGRQFPGVFERKNGTDDNARKPPREIAAFLSKMKTRVGRARLSKRMVAHLDWLRQKSPHGGWASYPGVANDLLFEATYDHKHRSGDCDECGSPRHSVCEAARNAHCTSLQCDIQKTVGRKRHCTIQDNNGRQVSEPAVHFGAYASGDKVMKSGEDRDEIGRREKVIAFEMEGAGIWDNMPTIIIKGVCDYADSHKNKDWQKYAATTAAACVKALLQDWPVYHQ